MLFDLKTHLPPIVSDVKDLRTILDTESKELRRLYLQSLQVESNFSIDTADEGTLDDWGDLLSLGFSTTTTIKEKRQQIYSILTIQRPYTLPFLKGQLDIILGKDNYNMNVNYADRTITIIIYMLEGISFKTVALVERTLLSVVPAHMGFSVSLGSVIDAIYEQFRGVYIQQSNIYDVIFS